MRFYDIQLLKPGTSNIVRRWTSYPNGVFNAAAQNILLDALVTVEDTPLGGSALKIEGVSLQDLRQSTKFGANEVNGTFTPGYDIRIFGGMGRGLPLANPKQQGLILAGTIWQSFGNWQGVEQALDLVIFPSLSHVRPANLTLNWPAGTSLADALKQTFDNGFPGYTQKIQISPDRVLNHDEKGTYGSVDRLASVIKGVTQGQLGNADAGVRIVVQSGVVFAFDGTAQRTPKQLIFTDLIGQPTWLDYQHMQVKTVMRGDLQVGDVIEMPQGLSGLPGQVIQTNPIQGAPGLRNQSTFTGKFSVVQIRHVGNFRSTNGAEWCSIFNCVAA